ncbi:glycosyltransferase family 4 protein [Telluribacter sp.]|jgi:glycosyltransferase involved in cell wall biosynthesis|uniref:glycosyltransferase family 4 protein n=1 Tax=Telluribacter sp. TaxID=1978767 RepID=UPI002E130AF4|nr:glycosyltransferase family 4 protein [Telluribacter sp.]
MKKKQADTPKRILFVVPRPTRGGATQVLLNLLEQVSSPKTIIPFAIYNDSSVLNDALSQLVEKSFASTLDKRSRMRNALIKLSTFTYHFLKRKYCKWVCDRVKPDVIYINTVNDTPHARQAIQMQLPIIVHAHEMDFLVTLRIKESWIQQLAAKASAWIVCSKAVGEFYNTTYGVPFEKIKLLHGPASLARTISTQQGYYRAALNCPPQCLVVGVSASFTYLKGADTFIKAIILAKQAATIPVRFAWLGLDTSAQETTFYKSMKELITQNGLQHELSILPSTSTVGDFYIDIDVFVLPSRTEAFPLSILEAMLYAKPIVAMDVGGIREVVDETTGYLVKDRTAEGLAAGILYMLESEERRREAGRRGRERVLEQFEAEVQAKKWIQILEEVSQ